MAEQPRRGRDANLIPLEELITPPMGEIELSIATLDIAAPNNFQFPAHVVHDIRQSVQFDGLPEEDAVQHLRNFMWLCMSMMFNGVSDDAVKLRLFPYTLRGRALHWLDTLPEGSITTWDQLRTAFLARYFLPDQRRKLRRDILLFQQDEDETLYDAWERFQDMLWKCPQHGIQKWEQVQIFYDGLDYQHQLTLDNASYGGLYKKNAMEALEIIQSVALRYFRISVERGKKSQAVVRAEDNDQLTALCAKMGAILSHLLGKANQYQLPAPIQVCYYCGGEHKSEDCLREGEVPPSNHVEDVDFVASPSTNNNPFTNTYNLGWKNHSNFSWRHSDQQQQQRYNVMQRPQQGQQQQPPQGYQPPHEREPCFKDVVTRYMQQNDARVQAIENSFRNIGNQLGQLIKLLSESSR